VTGSTAPGGGTIATRYATLTRGQASGVIALMVLVTAWLLTGALSHPASGGREASGSSPAKGSDVALYKAVVARVSAGEGYYDVAGDELRARHYPTRPAFNWRQPTYAWLLSRLPSPRVGNALLALLGLWVVLLTRRWFRESDLRARALLATALMTVSMAGCFVTDFVFLQESWAGAFIALSVCLFALDRWRLAVAAGLAALAFREFALLPCAIGLALALHRRRWSEVIAWITGLAIYAALMTWHLSEVARHARPDDVARSWKAFGGSAFLLETSRWNTLLIALPSWLVALILPFVLLGLAGWRAAGATRAGLIVTGYLVAFSFIGHPFNDYWGAIYAPLLPLGMIAAPYCVRDLGRAMRVRTPPPTGA
jgi:hypothetical protein